MLLSLVHVELLNSLSITLMYLVKSYLKVGFLTKKKIVSFYGTITVLNGAPYDLIAYSFTHYIHTPYLPRQDNDKLALIANIMECLLNRNEAESIKYYSTKL